MRNAFIPALTACCLVILLAGCLSRPVIPNRTTLTSDRVDLPTSEIKGYLVVEVRINGAGPFHLLVDTGCSGLALSEQAAHAAKLKIDFLPNRVNAIYEKVWTETAPVEVLESRGMRLENLGAVIIADYDFSNTQEACPSIDGILGVGPLRDVILEMDFPAKQVSVLRREKHHYKAAQSCTYEDIGIPRVEIEMHGQKLKMEFDTGSDGPLGITNFSAVPVLYPKVKLAQFCGGTGRTIKLAERSQLAGDARLGPLTLHNPPLAADPSGRIGVEILKTTKLAIDQHEKRIYFLNTDPVLTWAQETPVNQALSAFGFLFRFEGTAIYVVEVSAGSPGALSGLRLGDLVLTTNGQPAALSEAFTTAAKTGDLTEPITLQVKRGAKGEPFSLTLVSAMNTPEQIKTVIANYDHALGIDVADGAAFRSRAAAKKSLHDYSGAYLDFSSAAELKYNDNKKADRKAANEVYACINVHSALGLTYAIEDTALRVLDVSKGSASAWSGLRKGDRVQTINGQPAVASEAFMAAAKNDELSESLIMQVKRGEERKEFTLTLVSGMKTPEQIRTIIANFDHSIAVWPEEGAVYRLRATAKRAQKDYNGAILDYTKAASLEQDERIQAADFKAATECKIMLEAKPR